MDTDRTRCQRCGYLVGIGCTCRLPLIEVRAAREPGDTSPLMTPAEVAQYFRVDSKTVSRWAQAGKLASIRTAGGHRRYREVDVQALMNQSQS